tara:strand:- start:7659 stop:7925 length:267 start_codon:yes stop_codon:yes gene_type:complete
LFESIHIERQIVELSFVVSDGGIDEVIEACELVDVVPDFFGVCMEDVSAILVNVDALNLFTMDIATEMGAFVDDKTAFSAFVGFVGEH